MSVSVAGFPTLHAIKPRDERDPVALASWSLGVTGDATGGTALIECQLRQPNWVFWPQLLGISTNVQTNIDRHIRGFEFYPSLGTGVARNLELFGGLSPAYGSTVAGIVVKTMHSGPWPWWMAIDPPNLSRSLVEFKTENTNLIVYGCSVLALLYQTNCMGFGGPRVSGGG